MQTRKVKDRKDFLKRIKDAGYYLVKITKHARYTNEESNDSIHVPTGKKFSIPLHMRLLKEIQAKLDRANNGS